MLYEEITSRKNKTIVLTCELVNKKTRDENKLFFFEGLKLLKECLKSNFSIHSIFFTQHAFEKYTELLESAENAKLYLVTDEVYSKLTEEKSPQGIFVVASQKEKNEFSIDLVLGKGIIVLDEIQNPSNVGALLRSANALGNYAVLFCGACADIYNPKTVRAAMGALFNVDFYSLTNLESTFYDIKQSGRKIFGAMLSKEAKNICEIEIAKTDCLVFGNEGNGISSEILTLCDAHVIIPMSENAESLNAAAAAAIFIWEANRK